MQNILSDRKTLKNHKCKTWDWEASIRHNKKPTEGKNVRLEERNGTIEKKKMKDLVKNKKFVAKILENSQISQRRWFFLRRE